MELLHPVLSWTYFFTESTGLNTLIIVSFACIPIALFILFIVGYNRLEVISGTIIMKRKEKGLTLWEHLALKAPFSSQEDNEEFEGTASKPCHCIYVRNKRGNVKRFVLPSSIYDNLIVNSFIHKGLGTSYQNIAVMEPPENISPGPLVQQGRKMYFKYIFIMVLRNFLIVAALSFMALGIAGLKSRVLYRTSVAANVPVEIPFTVTGGTRMMIQIQKEDPHPQIDATVIVRNGSERESILETDIVFPSSTGAGEGAMSGISLVVDFKEMITPRIEVGHSSGGRYYLSLVSTPSPVWGYMILMIAAFILSLYFTEKRSRMVLADKQMISGRTESAGKILLWTAFFISAIGFIAAGGYLVIKAIDHFFRTGIWLTYDHFIQDILYKLSK